MFEANRKNSLAKYLGVSLEILNLMENKVEGKFQSQPSFWDWIDATYEMSIQDYNNSDQEIQEFLFKSYDEWFKGSKPKGINMEPKNHDEDPVSYVGEIKFEKVDSVDEMIKEPNHYAKHAIEPCTFVMKNELGFARGNVVKYITRAGHKKYDDLSIEESEIRDLKKASRYIEMEINLLEGKEIL